MSTCHSDPNAPAGCVRVATPYRVAQPEASEAERAQDRELAPARPNGHDHGDDDADHRGCHEQPTDEQRHGPHRLRVDDLRRPNGRSELERRVTKGFPRGEVVTEIGEEYLRVRPRDKVDADEAEHLRRHV